MVNKYSIVSLLLYCVLLFVCIITISDGFSNAETLASKIGLVERHLVFETVPRNLEEIVKSSGKIFAGRCLKIEKIDNDVESKVSVVKYKFKVTEAIRGVKEGEVITFKQWEPTVRDAGYEKGRKYILFLYPNSSMGLTSPVGFLQGLFDIEIKDLTDGQGEFVRNRVGNIGLSKNLKTKRMIRIRSNQYINSYLHKSSENGMPIKYEEFIEAVRYLANQ